MSDGIMEQVIPVIWKIRLPEPGDLNYVDLPVGAQVLAANVQDGYPVAWVKVQPDAPKVETVIHVVGTGWPWPVGMYGPDVRLEYRATLVNGPFVWHVLQGVVTA